MRLYVYYHTGGIKGIKREVFNYLVVKIGGRKIEKKDKESKNVCFLCTAI